MQLFEALRNALRLPELRRKIMFTIFILVVYQFATHIPVPGVSREALTGLTASSGGLLGVLNLLSGGAVSRFSVLANGVYPFITAQIILQLLTGVIPRLEAIAKEPGGQQKLNQYTYYLAIPMAILQSVGQVQIMGNFVQGGVSALLPDYYSSFLTQIQVIATMTAGTMFAIWMGNLITENGIGNGVSMIIFGGIVAQVPQGVISLSQDQDYAIFNLIAFAVLTVITVIAIIYIQEGVRRISVQYGKRVRGQKQYGGGSTHIPLKVNAVGMIPLIFAQAIITFPAVIGGLFFNGTEFGASLQQTFGTQSGFWYWFFEFLLVFAFTYFYTDVMIQQQNLSENLQRQGGFIPGIRPGTRTQDYITRVTRRITFAGALFLSLAAISPAIMIIVDYLLTGRTDINRANNPALVIGASGLIIVVGVVVDTMRQLESQLVMRNYDSFMR